MGGRTVGRVITVGASNDEHGTGYSRRSHSWPVRQITRTHTHTLPLQWLPGRRLTTKRTLGVCSPSLLHVFQRSADWMRGLRRL